MQLLRPLDFAAVTDHAELFGETEICRTPGLEGYDSLMCRVYRRWPKLAFFLMNGRATPFGFCGEDQSRCATADTLPWRDMREAAEAAYDRSAACSFTTFIAYEWTGYTHRNVIFRGTEVPDIAPSSVEFPHETDLWDTLEERCRDQRQPCDFVVIPHNSNVSASTTFQTTLPSGNELDAAEAKRKARNEPLVEIMQHKGSSECYAGVGTNDELCGFENVPYDYLGARFVTAMRKIPAANNFVREGLAIGMRVQRKVGVNPFRFGFIGSTDTHLGTPGLSAERNYPGHGGAGVPIRDILPDSLLDPIEYNPGGLAVLWAEENSRDALFAAMQRRETYATSGPRINFRFFGGWDLPADVCTRPDLADIGYARGVPMGGELPRNASAAPVFVSRALKDPGAQGHPGVALQRLQIIKLWIEDGSTRERVIEIDGSADNRVSINPTTCSVQSSGTDSLCARWRDDDFDSTQAAVYYSRVVQDPTCRWSTLACNQAGVRCDKPSTIRRGWEDCCNDDYPKVVQERAWTSPIWYNP